MIETRLLRQFIAVAEELHFHKAAERLCMAQPPLSQAIRKLEAEVGAALFLRSNRSVTLTPAGKAFLDSARRVLSTLDEGVERARQVSEGVAGRLTVTFVGIARYHSLLHALREFRATVPAVELTLHEATTAEQVKALEAGDADLGFLRYPGIATPSLRFETILREQIFAALPSGHALKSGKQVLLSALAHESFVMFPRPLGQGFHDQLIGLCQLAGFSPRIVQEARQMQTLVGLVAAGFGVALVPASVAAERRGDVVFLPIAVDAPGDMLHVDLVMAWNEGHRSPARDRLMTEVRNQTAQPARRRMI